MGIMRRLLKINVDFQKIKNKTKKKPNAKLQDVSHTIYRVRDSEHNKNMILAS